MERKRNKVPVISDGSPRNLSYRTGNTGACGHFVDIGCTNDFGTPMCFCDLAGHCVKHGYPLPPQSGIYVGKKDGLSHCNAPYNQISQKACLETWENETQRLLNNRNKPVNSDRDFLKTLAKRLSRVFTR